MTVRIHEPPPAPPPREAVADWFGRWLPTHRELFRGLNLPDPADPVGVQVYARWRSAFVRSGLMDYDVALAASERLLLVEHKPSQHFRLLVAEAMKVYRERADAGKGKPTDSREAAELASRGCEEGCCGRGLALRFRRHSRGHFAPNPEAAGRRPTDPPVPTLRHHPPADAEGRQLPDPVTFYCVCPMGRWVKGLHERQAKDVRARVPDLADYPWLQGAEGLAYQHPPAAGTPRAPARTGPPPAF